MRGGGLSARISPEVSMAPRSASLIFASALLLAAAPQNGRTGDETTRGSAGAHAGLFDTPKSRTAGAETGRLVQVLPPAGDSAPLKERNFIDKHIFGRMKADGIPRAPLSTDAEFLRRVRLDLTGRIPGTSELREFLADRSPDARSRLIARLIDSEEWVEKWTYGYMDLLRANGKMGRGVQLFHRMLKDSFRADRPYDDLARSLMASSAKSNYVVAAANPIVREHVEGKPGEADHAEDLSKVHQMDTHDELAILFGKVFLGINLSCVACHDGRAHLEKVNVYLSTKKRSDFFRQAAFFGNTRYIPQLENKEAVMGHFAVDDQGAGYDTRADSMLRIKRWGGPSAPKFFLTDEAARPDEHPRDALARMTTAHPQFARATVNLFWSKLMGFGLVEPVDEFDLARQDPASLPAGWELQPSHPELLEELASEFRKHNHSLKWLFSTICNSSAYQLSARFPGEWNDRYTKYYARKFVRMLTAEELHDAIATATSRPGTFRNGKESVPMAMQVTLPRAAGELKTFMQTFGQANRGTPARPPAPSPLQPIVLMRSPVVNDRVLAAKDSRVQRLLDTYTDNATVVDELFLATLSREPSPPERELALAALRENRVEGAQNLQWALLNLSEFLHNF
jgi:hypothetical protein